MRKKKSSFVLYTHAMNRQKKARLKEILGKEVKSERYFEKNN